MQDWATCFASRTIIALRMKNIHTMGALNTTKVLTQTAISTVNWMLASKLTIIVIN